MGTLAIGLEDKAHQHVERGAVALGFYAHGFQAIDQLTAQRALIVLGTLQELAVINVERFSEQRVKRVVCCFESALLPSVTLD